MINFVTLRSLAIPEGGVKKIVDISGAVLWAIKLSSIAVTTPPTKTEYSEGEVFDSTGMVVTATYSNGETKVVSGYTVLNGDQIAEDMTTVNISYTEDGVTVGTAYEVGFSSIPVITTRTNGYSSNYVEYAYIEFIDATGTARHINSVGYLHDASGFLTSFEIPAGTVITCYVQSKSSYVSAYVKVNGTKVATKSNGNQTYAYTVVGNATITLYTGDSDKYGYIEIVET